VNVKWFYQILYSVVLRPILALTTCIAISRRATGWLLAPLLSGPFISDGKDLI